MKRTAAALVLLLLSIAFVPDKALGQVFYQFSEAPVVGAGEFAAGPYLGVGDNELFRVGGFGRMNATKYFDVGFELVLDSANGDARIGAGGDIKMSLFPPTSSIPFDLSATVGVGGITSDEIRIVQVPVGGIVSSPFTLEGGGEIVPYLGVYLLILDTKIKRENVPDLSDTEVDVELRGALRYRLSAGTDIFAAFHIGRDELFVVGANFWPKGRN